VPLNIVEVCFKLAKFADNEYVIRSLERGAGEYEPTVGQDLKGSDGTGVCERLGGVVARWKGWVSRRLVRCFRDREEKELAARMITSDEVNKSGILRKLRDIQTPVQQTRQNAESHCKFINRSVPILRERVAGVFLEVVDDNLGAA
jgi:hypothetical protein